jgi:hypothetical protein
LLLLGSGLAALVLLWRFARSASPAPVPATAGETEISSSGPSGVR